MAVSADDFLTVRDLRVETARGRIILDVPELSMARGATLGLRGASGAGKTTFLRALMGLEPGAAGRVRWGDLDVSSMGAAETAAFRRDRIGMIFQDFRLFDELGAGANAAIQTLFALRAARAEIATTATALLDGMGVPGGDPVARFSGGERQRVALARALAHRPDIILADEPTASLDADAGQRVVDALLAEVAERGATLILVSHDEAVLARLGRVVTLAHGSLT